MHHPLVVIFELIFDTYYFVQQKKEMNMLHSVIILYVILTVFTFIIGYTCGVLLTCQYDNVLSFMIAEFWVARFDLLTVITKDCNQKLC